MKKTIRIHISGYIFNIEEDAYSNLENWLAKLSKQYSTEEGGDEIISDIEMRAAELFHEKIGTDGVISIESVSEIIKIMGEPEDIEQEAEFEEEKTKVFPKRSKGKKRFYRDEENSTLGGICSGIAKYFGIDPLIIRIIFIISIFFGGFGPIIYILLWLIIPKAETTAQKLEMKGEPVNISNIEKSIKDEFENVKKNLLNKANSESIEKIKKGATNIADSFANFIVNIFKGIGGIIGIGFIIAGLSALLAIFGMFFFNSDSNLWFFNQPLFGWRPFINLLPGSISSTVTGIGMFLLMAIPLIIMVFLGTRIVFKHRKSGKAVKFTGAALWIAGILITLFAVLKIVENYQSSGKHSMSYVLNDNITNTIHLELDDNYDKNYDEPDFSAGNYNIAKVGNSAKLYGKPTLNIVKSKDNNTNLRLTFSANGNSKKDAYQRTKNISYLWNKNDSVLNLQPYFTVKGNNKLYKRGLNLTLEIPTGQTIFIDSSIIDLMNGIENKENLWDHEMVNKLWKMTESGLVLIKNSDIQLNTDSIHSQETDTIQLTEDIHI